MPCYMIKKANIVVICDNGRIAIVNRLALNLVNKAKKLCHYSLEMLFVFFVFKKLVNTYKNQIKILT